MVKKFGNLPTIGETHLYTIHSGTYQARFTDLGATWVSFLAPDRSGQLADVILGFDSAQAYVRSSGHLGAVVGRHANRTRGAVFVLDGKEVRLQANEGGNNLHSGPDYWHLRRWSVEQHTADTITFGLDSPHGDQGFPGAGHIQVTYALSDGSLTVTYRARFDRDTIFNPTQHAYFNLAGQEHPERALSQYLTVHAARFTPVDGTSIPTGDIHPVAGTALDFTSPRVIGRGLENDPLLQPQRGLDHNFVLDCPGLDTPAATLSCRWSGRRLTVFTNCPGIQVYAANYLDAVGKAGVRYTPNSGICLETQFFPNSVNVPLWPQCTVRAGDVVTRMTRFVFDLEK